MANVFFTADQHWGHVHILDFCNRPFVDVNEMDQIPIERWNARVRPTDTVWHLGDFAWHNALQYGKQLHGRIHLVRGNHDKRTNRKVLEQIFCDVQDITTFKNAKPHLVLCHYPMITWPGKYRGVPMLHGHCHGKLEPWKAEHMPDTLLFDIGVDCWNYAPVEYEELLKAIEQRKNPIPKYILDGEE